MADFWAGLEIAVNWIIVVAVPVVGIVLIRLQRARVKLLKERVELAEALRYDKAMDIIEGQKRAFKDEREKSKQKLEEMEQELVKLRAENATSRQIASQEERITEQKVRIDVTEDVIHKMMGYATMTIPNDAVGLENWKSMFTLRISEDMKESGESNGT